MFSFSGFAFISFCCASRLKLDRTFNDNHTIWQPVFSDSVSTKSKRAKFINEIKNFLTDKGFDGVDFDWEYPGAPDRGGKPEDGVNFTKLLEELRTELDKMPGGHKEISFTAPTSYWVSRISTSRIPQQDAR